MISCKEYTENRKNQLKWDIEKHRIKPTLAVIQVDDHPASNAYIKGKAKDCEAVGINMLHIKVDSSETTQAGLEFRLKELSMDANVNGIIVQLPIPDKYNVDELIHYIKPSKDVDGFRGDSHFDPCTPKGIIDWMSYNGVNIKGANVVVIGRSNIVGKPLVNMLIDRSATVTCCNSSTSYNDLKYLVHNADVVISAVGIPKKWTSDLFVGSSVKLVVDVGINRVDGKLCGDVDYVDVSNLSDIYVTPVPGGVGLLTRLALIENVYNSAYSTKDLVYTIY